MFRYDTVCFNYPQFPVNSQIAISPIECFPIWNISETPQLIFLWKVSGNTLEISQPLQLYSNYIIK